MPDNRNLNIRVEKVDEYRVKTTDVPEGTALELDHPEPYTDKQVVKRRKKKRHVIS